MKSILNNLLVVGAVVMLTGCAVANCDDIGAYDGGPYADTERTAGVGHESVWENCHRNEW